MIKLILLFASISSGLAVILGAFGAHALKKHLSPSLLSAYETGVQYQFIHSLALLALGILLLKLEYSSRAFTLAGWGWMIGIMLFCGSLYALALGGPRWLGPITPLGGLFFIGAWGSFTVAVWQLRL